MLTSDFHFDLPPGQIAQRPLKRGSSRLLVLQSTGALRDLTVQQLPQLLKPTDLLVLNNTKVIPARLAAKTEAGAPVEVLLVRREDSTSWQVLTKPGSRTRKGVRLHLPQGLVAVVSEKLDGGIHRIEFSEPIDALLDQIGSIPLPPYIRRPAQPEDQTRYQTVYATEPGAIAAPTAGLHFTHELLSQIRENETLVETLTLHVGIGTFKPVRTALVHEHAMDEENYEIPLDLVEAIKRTRAAGGRVVAVGTTVVRALESAALLGGGQPSSGPARTKLFIRPGFKFQIVDALLTNFHLPSSSLLMLVCAFGGQKRVLNAYHKAVQSGYRFYSYGDAMLLEQT